MPKEPNTSPQEDNEFVATDEWQRYDSRQLILQSFLINALTVHECRSIFLDWSLGLPETHAYQHAAQALLKELDAQSIKYEEHPMYQLLQEAAQETTSSKRRRGGRSARVQS